MSSTSNKLNKPMNEVNAQGEILKVNGKTTFVMNYGKWFEEYKRLIFEIRSALNDQNHHALDEKLQFLVDMVMKHHFELFKMRTSVFNVGSSAIWIRTYEHDSWWIGGFRPSELLQVILPQLEHLCSEQQLCDILNIEQLCQQAEYALSHGMEKLQKNIDKAIAEGDREIQLTYVSHQVSFFEQADHLREEFLHQICNLLTISQKAGFLLALGEHLHKPHPQSSL